MVKFLIDSSSDYSYEEAKDLGVYFVSMSIACGDRVIKDGVDATKDEIFEMIENGEFPQTAQPSPQDFIDIFEEVKEAGDDLIYISLSSELSGTYSTAILAKNMVEYDNIYILNSRSAALPIKYMLKYAMGLAEEGKTAEEIYEKTNEFKSKVKLLACLNTLENLKRGGRLGKVEAGLGTLAKIKPTLTLSKEGLVDVLGKAVGIKKAMNSIIEMAKEDQIDTNYPVLGIYTYGTKNTENLIEKAEAEGIHVEDKIQIGPTVGCHIGSNACGIVYVTK